MEIILGIDPGTQIMGYSLLRKAEDKPELMLMDVLYLKKIGDYKLRIRQIFDKTQSIIDMYHPDHLAIEAQFFGKNVQSMLKLGRAQGVAIAAAMSRDLSYTEYEPATIKQMVTGNGNASKEQVASILQNIFGFTDEPQYFDATDALAVAYTCYMEQNDNMAELRKQLKVSHKKKGKKQTWEQFVNENPDRTV
jgi:crossover junction endodeoxyribonuclease RuvC